MEQRDLVYLLFWSFILTFVSYFSGFGEKALFLFSLSLLGIIFVEKTESAPYICAAVFLALGSCIYFSKKLEFLEQIFANKLYIAIVVFIFLPALLLTIRKKLK